MSTRSLCKDMISSWVEVRPVVGGGGRVCKGLVSLTAQGRREMLHMEAREQDWPGFPPFSKARFS